MRWPASFITDGTDGIADEALPAGVVPVEDDPDTVGRRVVAEHQAPLQPCSARFSAPAVLKTDQNLSQSANLVVARIIEVSLRGWSPLGEISGWTATMLVPASSGPHREFSPTREPSLDES